MWWWWWFSLGSQMLLHIGTCHLTFEPHESVLVRGVFCTSLQLWNWVMMCILSAETDHISKLQIATKLKSMLIDPVNFFSSAPKYRHIPIINLLIGKLLLLASK